MTIADKDRLRQVGQRAGQRDDGDHYDQGRSDAGDLGAGARLSAAAVFESEPATPMPPERPEPRLAAPVAISSWSVSTV